MPAQQGPQSSSPPANLVAALRGIVGADRVTTDSERIAIFSVDFSELTKEAVAVIVQPTERAQVARILRVAFDSHTPVVVRGGGMSYTLG